MSSGNKLPKHVAAECRNRVISLAESLPETTATPAGGRHLSLEVRGKRFGWSLENHHGDGRFALNLKSTKDVSHDLVAKAPDRFHVPKYIGHRGWVGVWLDSPAPDWAEIKSLLKDAYRLTAPKRLVSISQ